MNHLNYRNQRIADDRLLWIDRLGSIDLLRQRYTVTVTTATSPALEAMTPQVCVRHYELGS